MTAAHSYDGSRDTQLIRWKLSGKGNVISMQVQKYDSDAGKNHSLQFMNFKITLEATGY